MRDIFAEVGVINDRIKFSRGEVKHPDVLVATGSDHGPVSGDGQAVDLAIRMLDGPGADPGVCRPELDGVVIPGSGEDHLVSGHWTWAILT